MDMSRLQPRHGLDSPDHRSIPRRPLHQTQSKPQGRRRIGRGRGVDLVQRMGRQPADMPIRRLATQLETRVVDRMAVGLQGSEMLAKGFKIAAGPHNSSPFVLSYAASTG